MAVIDYDLSGKGSTVEEQNASEGTIGITGQTFVNIVLIFFSSHLLFSFPALYRNTRLYFPQVITTFTYFPFLRILLLLLLFSIF